MKNTILRSDTFRKRSPFLCFFERGRQLSAFRNAKKHTCMPPALNGSKKEIFQMPLTVKSCKLKRHFPEMIPRLAKTADLHSRFPAIEYPSDSGLRLHCYNVTKEQLGGTIYCTNGNIPHDEIIATAVLTFWALHFVITNSSAILCTKD
ncbi:hypothetical protein NDU88_007002 [Pleurodeles waltl]|uniref:Uncharacterized protein n=1 Tax=Pleurodeles waltl TaxID=8319 RepID=A0AAV7SR61_PLEWA|nr:hypothetical protein NDU88_007002 [Pleurodeles waltl]